eukprot:gene7723-9048_t
MKIIILSFNVTQSSFNGHYYEVINTLKNPELALADCAQRDLPGSGLGYLATFTTKAEWQWAVDIGLLINYGEVWISGTDLTTGMSKWYYSDGPEKDIQFYDSGSDICTGYCPWASTEPSLTAGESYLATFLRGTMKTPSINNMPKLLKPLPYICEYGGRLDPVVKQSSGTSGGLVIFDNYTPAPSSNLVVTFTKLATLTTFNCPVQTTLANGFTCLAPAGTGVYNVSVSDGLGGPIKTTQYQYLFGGSFGSDASLVNITLGNNATCINGIFLLTDYSAIECTISRNFESGEKFLPLTVIVDGIEHISVKTPFFHSGTGSFYSVFDAYSSFSLANTYALAATMDSYSGYLGVVVDSDHLNFITSMVGEFTVWEGLKYQSPNFVMLSGPNAGTKIIPYQRGNIVGSSDATRFTLNFATKYLAIGSMADDAAQSILIQFGGIKPILEDKNVTLGVQGGDITYTVTNLGLKLSKVEFIFNGVTKLPAIVSSPTTRTVTIPKSHGGPYTLAVSVDGIISNKVYVDYSPPTISEVSVGQTQGSIVTITGLNLLDDSMKFNLGGTLYPVTFDSNSVPTVQVPAGTGSATCFVVLGSRESNKITFKYASPVIATIESNTTIALGGYIELTGNNFGNDITKVSIIGLVATQLSIVKPHTTVGFFTPPHAKSELISITVDSQASNSITAIFTQYNPKVESVSWVYFNTTGNVTISGSGYADVSLYAQIGGKECIHTFFVDVNTVICYFEGTVPQSTNGSALSVMVSVGGFPATDEIFFYRPNITCPGTQLACSGNGVCNTDVGICGCSSGWDGSDCSLPITGRVGMAPVVNDNGTASLPSENFTFDLGIKYLQEVSIEDTPVRHLALTAITWTTKDHSGNVHRFIGSFPNDPCIFDVTITVFIEPGQSVFAGETMSMFANSVKFVVTVESWDFQSPLNRLQIIYSSKGTRKVEASRCPLPPLQSTTSAPPGALNWFQVHAQDVVLKTRFSSRTIVDGRLTQSSVVLVSNTTLLDAKTNDHIEQLSAIVVPHFLSTVTVDPNLGLLLQDYDAPVPSDSCETATESPKNNDKKKNKWRTPVITVLVVVGVIAIAVVAAFYVKKRLMGRRLRDVAMKSLSRGTRK